MDEETKDMPKSYAISGKIMLSAIIVLFFVVLLMAILHLYARCYILRTRRRQINIRRMRQRQRRTHIVFYGDLTNLEASSNGVGLASAATRGLDASVLNLLPAFVYSSKTHPESIDCAVCLSEFEEDETGRVLPKCNHTFHIDCIDMWFHSHSTCPLCRSTVEPTERRIETVIDVDQPGGTELGSSSGGVCSSDCQYETASEEDNTASSSSSNGKSKVSTFVGITVEVPRRNWSIGMSEDESGRCESPSSQSSFRSPMSRMLSFKRILSRERKANINNPSSPSSNVVGCSSVMEPILSDGGGGVESQ